MNVCVSIDLFSCFNTMTKMLLVSERNVNFRLLTDTISQYKIISIWFLFFILNLYSSSGSVSLVCVMAPKKKREEKNQIHDYAPVPMPLTSFALRYSYTSIIEEAQGDRMPAAQKRNVMKKKKKKYQCQCDEFKANWQ